MKKRSLWFAMGIAAGAAIHDSVTSILIGAGIALAPWVMMGLAHAVGWVASRKFWDEMPPWGPHLFTSLPPIRPKELDAFEYQRMYDTGEMPERWEIYEQKKEEYELKKGGVTGW